LIVACALGQCNDIDGGVRLQAGRRMGLRMRFGFVFHTFANRLRALPFWAVVVHGCDKPDWLLKPAFTYREELRWTWCGWAELV
jgi:hypothetical protein